MSSVIEEKKHTADILYRVTISDRNAKIFRYRKCIVPVFSMMFIPESCASESAESPARNPKGGITERPGLACHTEPASADDEANLTKLATRNAILVTIRWYC